MFETLMKAGSHRVDYLNHAARGKEGAFAFYVCGELPENAAYSTSAKHNLYTGLALIEQTLGHENLVGIYLDVHPGDQASRTAYLRMKEDMRAGMFRRVFVLRTEDFFEDNRLANDLYRFYIEIGGFDLLTFEQGAFKPVMLMASSALA